MVSWERFEENLSFLISALANSIFWSAREMQQSTLMLSVG